MPGIGTSSTEVSLRGEVLLGEWAPGFFCTPLCWWLYPSSQARVSDRGLTVIPVSSWKPGQLKGARSTSLHFSKAILTIDFFPSSKAQLARTLLESNQLVLAWIPLHLAFLRTKKDLGDPSTEGETSKKKQRELIHSSCIYSLILIYERLNNIVIEVGISKKKKKVNILKVLLLSAQLRGGLFLGTICGGSPRLGHSHWDCAALSQICLHHLLDSSHVWCSDCICKDEVRMLSFSQGH